MGSPISWLEILVGVSGIIMGLRGRLTRSSMVLALGILGVGVGHFLPKGPDVLLATASDILLLAGVLMAIWALISQKRRNGSKGNKS